MNWKTDIMSDRAKKRRKTKFKVNFKLYLYVSAWDQCISFPFLFILHTEVFSLIVGVTKIWHGEWRTRNGEQGTGNGKGTVLVTTAYCFQTIYGFLRSFPVPVCEYREQITNNAVALKISKITTRSITPRTEAFWTNAQVYPQDLINPLCVFYYRSL